VNATLDEDPGIVRLERELDTLDLTSLVRSAAYNDLHIVRVLLGQIVQIVVDLVESMVLAEVENCRAAVDVWRRLVDQLLNVFDVSGIQCTDLAHYLVEIGQLMRGYHDVRLSTHEARRFPKGELQRV